MLLTIVIVLILLGLALYGTSLLTRVLDSRIVLAIQVVLVIMAIFYLAKEAGIA